MMGSAMNKNQNKSLDNMTVEEFDKICKLVAFLNILMLFVVLYFAFFKQPEDKIMLLIAGAMLTLGDIIGCVFFRILIKKNNEKKKKEIKK